MLRLIFTALAILVLPLAANSAGPNRGGLATVKSDGNLAYGVNVRKVTRDFTGEYHVKFKRRVTDCYFFASPTNDAAGGGFNLSMIVTPTKILTNKRTVLVRTWESFTDKIVDHGFFLQVVC